LLINDLSLVSSSDEEIKALMQEFIDHPVENVTDEELPIKSFLNIKIIP
jgi:hypothetical protein